MWSVKETLWKSVIFKETLHKTISSLEVGAVPVDIEACTVIYQDICSHGDDPSITVGQQKKVTAVTFFRCPTVSILSGWTLEEF